jgi:crotonobetainyl-CoA:carnitine CoA-transferase CaiB-like acyl-CoA transferase
LSTGNVRARALTSRWRSRRRPIASRRLFATASRGQDGLAGGYAGYGLYEARDGWVSVAALEPHFRRRLCDELGLPELSHESLAGCFRTRSADAWEQWAAERDLPIEKVVGMQEGITSVEETV